MYKSNNNFIVIEGCEGAGKTTLLDALKASIGINTLFTREPGGTPLMAEIRKVILNNPHANKRTLAMLFAASRMDNLLTNIAPTLDKGDLVIADRYMLSSAAWQGGNFVTMKLIEDLEAMIQEYTPSLENLNPTYIFLDIEPEVGLARKKNNNQELTEFDKLDIASHKEIRDRYHYMMNSGVFGNRLNFQLGVHQPEDVSKAGCIVVDANVDIMTLAKTVMEIIMMLRAAK